jgi:cytochrome P450
MGVRIASITTGLPIADALRWPLARIVPTVEFVGKSEFEEVDRAERVRDNALDGAGMEVSTAVGFDPRNAATIDDPYPTYARLRRDAPVLFVEDYDMWVLTRYADVLHTVRTPTLFSSRLGMSPDIAPPGTASTGIGYRIGAPGVRVLIATDPPDHTVFRRAVSAAFSPGALRALTPAIDDIARQLARGLLERNESGDADLFRDLAEPLPVLVLAEVFGVPPEMRDEFREWSRIVTSDLESEAGGETEVGRGFDMFRYFRRELRRRRDKDTPGLLAALSGASGMTEYELLAFCAFLLVAGIETTTNLLTNLLRALMQFPEEQRLLRDSVELIDNAIEEGLRYDSPVQALWRATTEPTEIGGTHLPANARVLVVFSSANRDDAKFEDPDRFSIARSPNEHVGFGNGPHYCLGARLARAEVRAVLSALLGTTRWMHESSPPDRMRSLILRGLVRQPVAVEPA